MNNFDWGPVTEEGQRLLTKEIFDNHIYEKYDEVRVGDIILDLGATTGDFVYSILGKNPLHVYALEPSTQTFPFLVKNTRGFPVTPINKAISNEDVDIICYGICHSDSRIVSGITFQTLINLYSLDHIDFLKTDCEGGEYSVFTKENFDYIYNHVGAISGEWHLSTPLLKKRFREFRDRFLPHFNYQISDIGGTDIKDGLMTNEFINYYNEIFIYIRRER
jgi:FkbM family methyltransferase